MDPWTIIGWLLLVFVGGALMFAVLGFLVSLTVESVRTLRHERQLNERARANLQRYLE